MAARIVVSPEIPETHDLRGLPLDAYFVDGGETAARSRSSDTVALVLAGRSLHVKRYRYSGKQAFRGMLRNTFRGPSRVRAEYETIHRLRERLGDVAPRAAAYGEERSLGFLRRAFLATDTVGEAPPVGEGVDLGALGAFLRRLHDGGFAHGRLYARNLLDVGDGTFRVVDLDRAVLTDGRVRDDDATGDLAHLIVSVERLDEGEFLAAYGRTPADLESRKRAAAAGLERRTSGPPHV